MLNQIITDKHHFDLGIFSIDGILSSSPSRWNIMFEHRKRSQIVYSGGWLFVQKRAWLELLTGTTRRAVAA